MRAQGHAKFLRRIKAGEERGSVCIAFMVATPTYRGHLPHPSKSQHTRLASETFITLGLLVFWDQRFTTTKVGFTW